MILFRIPNIYASFKCHSSQFLSNPEVTGTVLNIMEDGQQGTRTFLGLRDPELLTKIHIPKVTMEGILTCLG